MNAFHSSALNSIINRDALVAMKKLPDGRVALIAAAALYDLKNLLARFSASMSI